MIRRKCEYCPHETYDSVETIGDCPCICHFGRTYLTFGDPKV